MVRKETQSLSVALAASLLLLVSCGGSEPPKQGVSEKPRKSAPETPVEPTTPRLPAQPTLRNESGEVVCPVTGKRIPDLSKAAGWADYKGLRYYFCSPACPDEFARTPDKYAVKR